MNPLGSVLKGLRKSRRMRQAEMAEALHARGCRITTKTGVSHLERRGTSRHEVLEAYGDIFGKSASEIVRMASENEVAEA